MASPAPPPGGISSTQAVAIASLKRNLHPAELRQDIFDLKDLRLSPTPNSFEVKDSKSNHEIPDGIEDRKPLSSASESLHFHLNQFRQEALGERVDRTVSVANLLAAYDKIAELENSNHEVKQDMKKLENQVRKAQVKWEATEIALEESQQEVAAFKAGEEYTQDLRKKHKALKAELEAMKCATSKEKIDNASQIQLIQKLEAEVAHLKSIIEQREPLFRIGVHGRLRFLELAREVVLYTRRDDNGAMVVENGNTAAHRGLGEIDSSLFYEGILSPADLSKYLEVFKELYHHNPVEHSALPSSLQEAIDHEVTIRTIRPLNTSAARPVLQKQLAIDNIDIIRKRYAAQSDDRKEEFNTDPDVLRRLANLRDLTDEIIEYDRAKFPSARKSSTAYGTSTKEEQDPFKSPTPGLKSRHSGGGSGRQGHGRRGRGNQDGPPAPPTYYGA